MIIKEYDDPSKFIAEYETLMLEKEAVSQLVLYSAYKTQNLEFKDKTLFGAVRKDDTDILLFSNVPPHNLILYAIISEYLSEAAAAVADFLSEHQIRIAGVNGKLDVCQSFIEQYKLHMNCSFVQKRGMDIMEIRKVNEIKPVEGNHRLALPDEDKLIADWMIQFQIEALTSELDYEAALNRAKRYIEEGKVYLYEDSEQKVVSMAIAARKLVNGICITYIFTPEEFRGKGYAAANIYYVSKEQLEQGKDFCTLFVDKNNPLTNRAYEKVGYTVLEDNYEFVAIINEV